MNEPILDRSALLEKFEGKGGWTFSRIPEILPDPKAHFGWVRVRGSIDGFELSNYRLMPMGNGQLFLPVRAEIRKKIKKEAGDTVHVVLYRDELPAEIPDELATCLALEKGALERFLTYSDGEQKAFCDWVYSAKTDETKVERIARTIDAVMKGKKWRDK